MGDNRIGASYDLVAEMYENRFVDELAGKPRDRELLDDIASRPTGIVVDVGCGPGQIGAYVGQRGRDVIGVDLSHAMARRAAGRLTASAVADMLVLPFRERSVGEIVAFYSVIHLARRDLGRAFREFARVLEFGGHAMVAAHEGEGDVEVTTFLGRSVDLAAIFFGLDELTDAASAAGLEVVMAERRPPYANEGSTVRLYVEAVKL